MPQSVNRLLAQREAFCRMADYASGLANVLRNLTRPREGGAKDHGTPLL